MSQPTIDEMIHWLRDISHYIKGDVVQLGASHVAVAGVADLDMAARVIAVLEQYHDGRIIIETLTRNQELQAIRAFVERVHKRADDLVANDNSQELFSEHFMEAFLQELKALEKK